MHMVDSWAGMWSSDQVGNMPSKLSLNKLSAELTLMPLVKFARLSHCSALMVFYTV